MTICFYCSNAARWREFGKTNSCVCTLPSTVDLYREITFDARGNIKTCSGLDKVVVWGEGEIWV